MAKKLVQIEVTGVNAVQQAAKKAGDRYEQAMAAALYQKGFAVDRDAVLIVPVDTGRLRNSHYVAPPRKEGQRFMVEVGFGTDYAVQVHERPNPPGRTEGQSNKFLEKAMNKHSKGYRQDIKRRTQKNYKAGIGVSAVTAAAPKRPKA